MKFWIFLLCFFMSLPQVFAQKVQENMCEQEFQAINEDILAKARQANECNQILFSAKEKKNVISSFTVHLNGFYSKITKTDDPVKILDTVSFTCASTDKKQSMIHLILMEMTEESMENMEMDTENRCATQVAWSPKTDSLQWTPSSSSNYGWVDITPSGEEVGGYYILSSNKTFMEKFSTADSEE